MTTLRRAVATWLMRADEDAILTFAAMWTWDEASAARLIGRLQSAPENEDPVGDDGAFSLVRERMWVQYVDAQE